MKIEVLIIVLLCVVPDWAYAQKETLSLKENRDFHSDITKGIKLVPGQWRPNFLSEQIVWISPP